MTSHCWAPQSSHKGGAHQPLFSQAWDHGETEAVASAMNMASRPQRRRLLAEKTSCVAILEDVRCSLALESPDEYARPIGRRAQVILIGMLPR
jgi:hypothetical protein